MASRVNGPSDMRPFYLPDLAPPYLGDIGALEGIKGRKSQIVLSGSGVSLLGLPLPEAAGFPQSAAERSAEIFFKSLNPKLGQAQQKAVGPDLLGLPLPHASGFHGAAALRPIVIPQNLSPRRVGQQRALANVHHCGKRKWTPAANPPAEPLLTALPLPRPEGFEKRVLDRPSAVAARQLLNTPDTPCSEVKKLREANKIPAVFRISVALYEGLLEGVAKDGEMKGELVKWTYSRLQGGKGSFFQTYRIISGPQLYRDIPNEKLVVKGFLAEHWNKPRAALEWLDNFKEEYEWCREYGIARARVYNIQTLVEDAYVVQEFVPGEFEIDEWKTGPHQAAIPVVDLSSKAQNNLRQVRKIFHVLVTEKHELDLDPKNLRITVDGVVVLIDWPQERDTDEGMLLEDVLGNHLRKICGGNSYVAEYLTATFKETHPEMHQALMKRALS